MTDPLILPTAAELLEQYASRFSLVRLVPRYWQQKGNICFLYIVRGNAIVAYDTDIEPEIDVSTLHIPLGSTNDAGDKTVGKMVEHCVVKGVADTLKSLQFKIVRQPEVSEEAFYLECLSGEVPDGLNVKGSLKGFWRTFLPDGSPEQAAYLAALRFELANPEPLIKEWQEGCEKLREAIRLVA